MGYKARVALIVLAALYVVVPVPMAFATGGPAAGIIFGLGFFILNMIAGRIWAIGVPQELYYWADKACNRTLPRWLNAGREIDRQKRIDSGKRERVAGSLSAPPTTNKEGALSRTDGSRYV